MQSASDTRDDLSEHGETRAPASEAQVLLSHAVDALPSGALEEKLAAARAAHRQLRVKLGIDPTAPDIHLGHAVLLRKLRAFQDFGHRVVLIIGDTTALVGDPSGRSTLRPMLSEEQIEENARTFEQQAGRILRTDAELLEVRHNSEWLTMGLQELLVLMRTTTLAQLLEREDFSQRWRAAQPISMLELAYPLLQGYDSVAVAADVELGGTDQKFNLLLGRDIQRAYGEEPQAILTMPILPGLDGERKMSKSLRNDIAITDPPEQMYGKTMSIPDSAMATYCALLLDEPPSPQLGPRDAKRLLARELVRWLHGEQEAIAAEEAFDALFLRREQPTQMEQALLHGESIHLPALIAEALGLSRSDARRLIDQGGVSVDGAIVAAGAYDHAASALDGKVLQVGKRRFRRLQRA